LATMNTTGRDQGASSGALQMQQYSVISTGCRLQPARTYSMPAFNSRGT
jgi:hypothetical protein